MIKLIVVIDPKNGIAKNGKIPWSSEEDLSFFRDMTIGKGHNAIVMGRKTAESLPAYPLFKRDNYIISKKDGIELSDIAPLDGKYEDVWVIGGESIYKQVIDKKIVDEIYISIISSDYDCDQFFNKKSILKNYKIKNTIVYNTFTFELYGRK